MKGTNVDGVYSADPKIDPSAERFDRLSYIDVLTKILRWMLRRCPVSRKRHTDCCFFNPNIGRFMNVLQGTGNSTVVRD